MPSNPLTLEDAITQVAVQASARGITLTRTKLVKLLYFVDLRAWEQLGHTVTGVEWIWHNYGPYSSSIVEACNKMAVREELNVNELTNYFGSPEYRIRTNLPAYYEMPGRDFINVVRSVVQDFGHLRPSQIGDLSYETDPMRSLILSHGRRGDTIEFTSSPPTPDEVSSTVSRYAKRVRNSAVEQPADEGDVGSGLRDEMEALDTARRSANKQVLMDR